MSTDSICEGMNVSVQGIIVSKTVQWLQKVIVHPNFSLKIENCSRKMEIRKMDGTKGLFEK